MICPRCHAEYRPGFTTCADCGIALVEELDFDATTDDEEVEEMVGAEELEPFHETGSSDELGAILEVLEEHSIPYVVQAGTALSLLAGGAFQGLALPEEWTARVLVLGARLKEARTLLEQLRAQARDAARPSRGASGPFP